MCWTVYFQQDERDKEEASSGLQLISLRYEKKWVQFENISRHRVWSIDSIPINY